jgi:hypothetical protein
MPADCEEDWRSRWESDRKYSQRTAAEWASRLVAAGVPPVLVSDALTGAADVVSRGIDASTAEITDRFASQEPSPDPAAHCAIYGAGRFMTAPARQPLGSRLSRSR